MTLRLTHLMVLLAISTLGAAVGGVAATWWIADREFRDVLDDDLEMQTELLAELITDEDFGRGVRGLEALLADAYESDDEETLWVTVYDTRDGTHVSNLDHDLPFAGRDEGPLDLELGGHAWRGFREDEGPFVVQVMRRGDLFDAVRADILEDIVTPVLAGGALNLVLIVLLIAFFLLPMTRLARELETRSAKSLAAVEVRTPGREIRVLRDALNDLMRDVADVLGRERRFASDVAHELRTPLTTLKLELSGGDPDLAAVKSEIDRLARLVEQLLTLARLEQGEWQARFDPVALDDLCRRSVSRFEAAFAEAGMIVEWTGEPAAVTGDATLLEILLRNLLKNVLAHCKAGTRAMVSTYAAAGGARLRVDDTGDGLPPAIRAQMARGAARLDSRGEGLGLGLAICHRIAAVHGADIAFLGHDDGAPGLVVEVTFPARRSA